MAEGWIKIHRSILEKGWSNRPDFVALWLHILAMASHRDCEYFWNGKTIILKPGQFITGRKSLSEKTGIHESSVQRILNVFESEQQIEQQKTSTSRLISICNWKKYQDVEQRFEQPLNNERTTAEQRLNTKQELKEVKKGRRGTFTPPELFEVIDYFKSKGFMYDHEANKFFNHYQSNGWLVGGKAKMKDWHAASNNWIARAEKFADNQQNAAVAQVGTAGNNLGPLPENWLKKAK